MNKKGYTLIEIIVVIAIIATVGTVGAIGLSRIISNSKQTRYSDLERDLKAAGNTYFTIYSEYDEYSYLKEDLYGSKGEVLIPIQTLKEALLVDRNLKNPKDNKPIYGRIRLYMSGGAAEGYFNYGLVICEFTDTQLTQMKAKTSEEIAEIETDCVFR